MGVGTLIFPANPYFLAKYCYTQLHSGVKLIVGQYSHSHNNEAWISNKHTLVANIYVG